MTDEGLPPVHFAHFSSANEINDYKDLSFKEQYLYFNVYFVTPAS